jgi:hypothetical protein
MPNAKSIGTKTAQNIGKIISFASYQTLNQVVPDHPDLIFVLNVGRRRTSKYEFFHG